MDGTYRSLAGLVWRAGELERMPTVRVQCMRHCSMHCCMASTDWVQPSGAKCHGQRLEPSSRTLPAIDTHLPRSPLPVGFEHRHDLEAQPLRPAFVSSDSQPLEFCTSRGVKPRHIPRTNAQNIHVHLGRTESEEACNPESKSQKIRQIIRLQVVRAATSRTAPLGGFSPLIFSREPRRGDQSVRPPSIPSH